MQTPQTDLPWLPVIAIAGSLLGGGMMGSIITLLVTNYRNRRQPIGYSIEIIEVFKKKPELPSLRAILEFPLPIESGEQFGYETFSNLSVVRVKVTNKGNQDIAEFKMGMTLEENTSAFDIKIEALDRHHVGEILTPVDIRNTRNELDYVLTPFNRSDPYTINVYVTYKEDVGAIKLSSAHSTRFVEIGSFNEARRRDVAVHAITLCLTLVGMGLALLGHNLTSAPGWSSYPLLGSIALVVAFAAFAAVGTQILSRSKTSP